MGCAYLTEVQTAARRTARETTGAVRLAQHRLSLLHALDPRPVVGQKTKEFIWSQIAPVQSVALVAHFTSSAPIRVLKQSISSKSSKRYSYHRKFQVASQDLPPCAQNFFRGLDEICCPPDL